jgi:hypothetical protein
MSLKKDYVPTFKKKMLRIVGDNVKEIPMNDEEA